MHEEPRHMSPSLRGRPRPAPYSKPLRGGAGGYPPSRGGRIKHMAHDRRSREKLSVLISVTFSTVKVHHFLPFPFVIVLNVIYCY